jgi:hypothetical protein
MPSKVRAWDSKQIIDARAHVHSIGAHRCVLCTLHAYSLRILYYCLRLRRGTSRPGGPGGNVGSRPAVLSEGFRCFPQSLHPYAGNTNVHRRIYFCRSQALDLSLLYPVHYLSPISLRPTLILSTYVCLGVHTLGGLFISLPVYLTIFS